MAGERKPVAEMLADLAREGGLLWTVFGLLDCLLQPAPKATWTMGAWVAMVLLVGVALMTSGIVAERMR